MKIKKSIFGYSKKEVEDQFEATNRLIELQKRDIEFLKKDNERLKSVLESLSLDKE